MVVGTRLVRINTKPALVKVLYVNDIVIDLPSVLKSNISNHLFHLDRYTNTHVKHTNCQNPNSTTTQLNLNLTKA